MAEAKSDSAGPTELLERQLRHFLDTAAKCGLESTAELDVDAIKTELDLFANTKINEEVQIYYGVPEDVDVFSQPISKRRKGSSGLAKPDANVPPVGRIPLPAEKYSDVRQMQNALANSWFRVSLNKKSLPSVNMYTILNAQNTVNCADISEDTSFLAIGYGVCSLKVFGLAPDRKSGKFRSWLLIGHSSKVYSCSFSLDATKLISGSEDRTIRLWSGQTWSCTFVYKSHSYPVWDVKFAPHGNYFASSAYDKVLFVWSTVAPKPVRMCCGHTSSVDCVLFHPNSNYIASGSSDHTVRLWDMLDGKMVRIMKGHTAAVLSLAFSICGRFLASGSFDKTIIIWDISNGQLVKKLTRHSGAIVAMCFSRDGNILAAGALDCILTLWNFDQLRDDYLAPKEKPTSYLLGAYPTKSTPFLKLHFTQLNMLQAVGEFRS